jgi:hypothetical protein
MTSHRAGPPTVMLGALRQGRSTQLALLPEAERFEEVHYTTTVK